MPSPLRPGSLVALRKDSAIVLAVVAGEEKRRVVVVLEGGREERVTESRILFAVEVEGSVPGMGPDERHAAGERVGAMTRRLRARADEVDVPLVWEIVTESHDAASGRILLATSDLAQLALEDASGAARLAMIWALRADGLHFTGKGEEWEPRSPRAVEDLQVEREKVAAGKRETEATFAALRAAARGEEYRPAGGPAERRYLDALERLAVEGEAAEESVRATALEALQATGLRWDRPHEAAFRLLRAVGRFVSDDENLQLRRFGLRTEFPAEVLERASVAGATGPAPAERTDLTGLEVVSIDGAATREIDDALSVEDLGSGAVRLGVHISDPTAFVRPGDAVDQEALARGVTHYFPDARLTMLPVAISEQAASLVQDEPRPAISFLVDLDPEGKILGHRLLRSWIRSRARLEYGQADAMIRDGAGPHGEALRVLARVGEAREAARVAQGAIAIRAPEVDLHVSAAGEISLERIEAGSAARRAVSEAMILVGAVAAQVCGEAGIVVIHRRQAPPAKPVARPATWDPVAVRAVRRTLQRAEAGLRAGPHHSLGLPAYAQVTSPLRRYQDLAIHRQILAHLAGEPPPYDAEAMQRILGTTELAERNARLAERARAEYWLLRYLESQVGQVLDAHVVDTKPRTIVQLDETLREQPLSSLAGVEPGEPVRVRVERVSPRASLLVLRAVGTFS